MQGKELTLDDCKRIIDVTYEMNEFTRINLAGGEPMMAKNKLSMSGISVDSMDDVINKLIGRETIKNIVEICEYIKKANIKLKINLCISKHNVGYDFKPIIECIKPDRLKVLQVLPTKYTKNVDSLIITKEEFHEVCNSLKKFNPICEDNDFMREAYWILDSEGYYGKDNLHMIDSNKIRLV